MTASNSPYINAGYDLYSTSDLANNTETGTDGDGAFTVGRRITSLPSFITGVTSAGANSSADGYQSLDAVIDNPEGGTVQSGVLYYASSSPTAENDLLNISIGSGAPSSFYIGALIDTTGGVGPSGNDPDYMRLRQTTGGSGNSGLIFTRNTVVNGDVDLALFQVTGAESGDVYTLSGVQSILNPGGHYEVSVAGLTFSTSVPEPNSGILLLLALVGLMSVQRIGRYQQGASA